MYRNHNGEITVGAEGADHDALITKLGEARDELFDYERMFETCMINGPEYVVDEMVSEIKRLREGLDNAAGYISIGESAKANDFICRALGVDTNHYGIYGEEDDE